ncbi:alpha/beta fold hydrolase [Methylobacterium sp. CM6257]|jgi:pimeloyl-ACP methyl ester carboxylesterase
MRIGHFHSVSRGDFHPVAYTDWGPRDSKQVAICVHGLTRQGRDFDALAQVLARAGWRVVCPDLVGRGRSGRLKDPDDYALPQYLIDMTVLIAHLGVDMVDWVGTSLGGLIGILLAGKPSSPIRSLVINDIGPFLPWAALRRIGDHVRSAPRSHSSFAGAERYLREAYKSFGSLTDEHWEHLARHSFIADPTGGWRPHFDAGIGEAFRPGRIYNVNLWNYWDAISCRTLLLRGEHSDLLQPGTADLMTRRGPCAQRVEIPSCGHAPALLERDQIDIITDWLLTGAGPQSRADGARSAPCSVE